MLWRFRGLRQGKKCFEIRVMESFWPRADELATCFLQGQIDKACSQIALFV
jgi:hypothetical protein